MTISSFIPDYEQQLLIKLLISFVIGLLIGYERDKSGKPAGMRTQMLICVGSALLAGISVHLGDKYVAGNGIRPDPARLMAQIVSGIGFVGAGVILKNGNRITGVTTAATLWLTAAIGIAIGSGFYASSILATIFILLLRPLAGMKVFLGVRSTAYVIQIPKKSVLEVQQVLHRLSIRYHTDDSHETFLLLNIFTSDKKIAALERTLAAKDLPYVLRL
jgi:uncharacterized membrane protein YhiD involved in acid resistance